MFEDMISKNKVAMIFTLQIMNIIFSLNSVLIKCVSVSWHLNGLFAMKTMLLLGVSVIVLAIYAVAWQMILTHMKLAVAYLSKGMVVFWGLIWSVLFFQEQITWVNLLGVSMIFCGTLLVYKYE